MSLLDVEMTMGDKTGKLMNNFADIEKFLLVGQAAGTLPDLSVYATQLGKFIATLSWWDSEDLTSIELSSDACYTLSEALEQVVLALENSAYSVSEK